MEILLKESFFLIIWILWALFHLALDSIVTNSKDNKACITSLDCWAFKYKRVGSSVKVVFVDSIFIDFIGLTGQGSLLGAALIGLKDKTVSCYYRSKLSKGDVTDDELTDVDLS